MLAGAKVAPNIQYVNMLNEGKLGIQWCIIHVLSCLDFATRVVSLQGHDSTDNHAVILGDISQQELWDA